MSPPPPPPPHQNVHVFVEGSAASPWGSTQGSPRSSLWGSPQSGGWWVVCVAGISFFNFPDAAQGSFSF